jgi:hypothetical protein
MTDRSVEFQTAIYTALDAALSVPVYDSVPQDATYPYVTIDFQDDLNADYISDRKTRKMMYFAVWSDYRGQKEVLEIMAAIDTALHQKTLTLSAGRVAQLLVMTKKTNREPDGVTYMGQLRLSALIEH